MSPRGPVDKEERRPFATILLCEKKGLLVRVVKTKFQRVEKLKSVTAPPEGPHPAK